MPKLGERVTVACAAVDAIDILTARPSDWIVPFFRIASEDGERAGRSLQEAGGRGVPATSDHLVLIDVDDAQQLLGGAVMVPFRWHATGFSSLYRRFDGRLIVWETRENTSILAIEGVALDSPFEAADRTGQDIAEEASGVALKSLLGNLRAAIEESLRARS